ncbi:M20/M25/M40 family metallo-hydrolase [Natronococcus sp. A-GB7]|uniref:M20/M25/M40 family metallo-hydrolase n=1 Tax=Natronococcus sp. A-GB7 TaxID=3037649 RepID=UPI00241CCE02|nr:M20/M25/M40 family metallo-hydrolase [Natronococcus sp. A-GB7]MDG5820758.1 M20/M25/M40 family metallo-hydrolase [Natronococcus sp. A-GB7]
MLRPIKIIPSEVRFTAGVGNYNDAVVENSCEREGTDYDLKEIWQITHTEFSPMVIKAAIKAARKVDTSHPTIISGTGHEASYLNDSTKTAMLFVPSINKKTHDEAEYTDWDDAITDSEVYAEMTR